jgi:TATA-binding protein-associated factor Taf7
MELKENIILQITPAIGFSAVFANDDATVSTCPLACWALVRRTLVLEENDWKRLEGMRLPAIDLTKDPKQESVQSTRVEGMASKEGRILEMCEDDPLFLGYIGAGENPLSYQDKARELIDSFEEDEEDEDDEEEDEDEQEGEFENMTEGLPQALSHLSVQIQERLRKGDIPARWEQGGWLEFMKRFGDLAGG